jgi:outer membrane immunogenic protein
MTLRTSFILAAAIGFLIAPKAAEANCGEGAFNGFYIGANAGWGWSDAEQVTKGFVAEDSGSGFVAGVLSGYNLQCGRFLVGFETDFNYSDIEATSDYPPPDPAYLTSTIDWFGTVRGRLGYVHDEKPCQLVAARRDALRGPWKRKSPLLGSASHQMRHRAGLPLGHRMG